MPLGTRDLNIILRARDQAKQVIDGVGKALDQAGEKGYRLIRAGAILKQAGQQMLIAGGAVAAGLAVATKQAADFDTQIRRAATQVDIAGESMTSVIPKLADVVKGVAADVAVPIDQLTAGMYDILSTVKVTVPQAGSLLRLLSQAAVAGGTDLETTIKAVLNTMNGLGIGLENTNDILDLFFQIVRKGGSLTLEEFTQVIGRSIPTMRAYGQDIKQVAAGMTFLTKNGVPAANAAVALSRATQAIFSPKAKERLEKIGVETVDPLTKKFRSMTDVVLDLAKAANKLPDAERIKLLTELFKGAGGTEQARRFLSLAIADPKGLEDAVKAMNEAKGVLAETYKVMANAPNNQIQLFKNNIHLLGIEAGTVFLPYLSKAAEGIRLITHVFADAPEPIKKLAVALVAASGVFLLLMGTMLLLGGTFVTITTAMNMLAEVTGLSVTVMAGAIGGLGLALLALSALVVASIVYWDSWKDEIKTVLTIVAWVGKGISFIFAAAFAGVVKAAKLMSDVVLDVIEFISDQIANVFRMFGKIPGLGSFGNLATTMDKNNDALKRAHASLDTAANNLVKGASDVQLKIDAWLTKMPDAAVKFGDKVKDTIEDVRGQFKALQKTFDEAKTGVAPEFDEKKDNEYKSKMRAFIADILSLSQQFIDKQINLIKNQAIVMFDLSAVSLHRALYDTGTTVAESVLAGMADKLQDVAPDVQQALNEMADKIKSFRDNIKSSGLNNLKLFPDPKEIKEQVDDTAYTLDQLVANLTEGIAKAAEDTTKKFAEITKQDLMNQMNDMLKQTRDWATNVRKLVARVGPDATQILGDMGLLSTDMLPYLQALNSMTDQELSTWVAGVQENFGTISNLASDVANSAFGGLANQIVSELTPAMDQWTNAMKPAIDNLTLMRDTVDQVAKSIDNLTDAEVQALLSSNTMNQLVGLLSGQTLGGAGPPGTLGGTYNGQPIGDVFGGTQISLNFNGPTDVATIDYAKQTFEQLVATLKAR